MFTATQRRRGVVAASLTMVFAVSSMLGASAAAQTSRKASSAETERMSLGVFPGVETGQAEAFQIVDRFLPLAKYLGSKTGIEILLVPVKIPDVAMKQMAEGRASYKLFYGPPVFASDAIRRANFVPIVVERERIKASFVVRADSRLKSLDEVDDQHARLALPPPSLLLSLLAKETLSKKKVGVTSGAIQHMGSVQAMKLALDNAQVDVMVVRDRSAKALMTEQPGKYRVIGETVDAPGFALIAHSAVPEAARARLRQAALQLAEDGSPLAVEAKAGLKASPFVASRPNEFAELQRIMDSWKSAAK